MASEEDNFDIDIYGDGEGEGEQGNDGVEKDVPHENDQEYSFDDSNNAQNAQDEPKQENGCSNGYSSNGATIIPNADGAACTEGDYPKKAPQQQGVKRKESSDDRPTDPGATTAVLISELHWWSTEDDIRGWANQAGYEDELKDVTFSEHKVNGKSKGQAFVEFSSPQAASATKHKIEALGSAQPAARKHTVVYTNPMQNPFKTLPKDAPARGKDERPQRSGSNGSYNPGGPTQNYTMNNGGYRGGRGGGYNNRGALNNSAAGGTFNNRGGYSSPMNTFNNSSMAAGFQNNGVSGMNGMNNFGGFSNRGGGMMGNGMRGGGGMRGSRGGMNGGMMPMGAMSMSHMGMAGSMNPIMAGMGMQGGGGFQGNPHFNPAFFQSNNAAPPGGDGSWNPHGAKRTRQE